jgi:hypothetical protein
VLDTSAVPVWTAAGLADTVIAAETVPTSKI